MFNRQNFFDQPSKSDMRKQGNIQQIMTVHGDVYRTGCFLDYAYIKKKKKNNKTFAIKFSKQQALDHDPKVTQQISINGNIDL